MEQNKDKIVLDLETKKTFDEVGGQHNRHLLGVSLVGVYSYNKDKYRVFREEEFGELLTLLKTAQLIIGFNSKSFDFTVLQPYFKDFDLFSLGHLDILEEVVYALGHRLKLETIAQSTLGYGKSGQGLDAIYYFKQGDWDSLAKYCLDDVKVTKEVYDYGQAHGHIWYTNSGRKEKIIARWAKENGRTITEKIQDALRDGQQLEIEYMDEAGNDSLRKIDIQRIYDGKVKAYCHLRGAVRVFDIDKIKQIKVIGKMSSWQKTLI